MPLTCFARLRPTSSGPTSVPGAVLEPGERTGEYRVGSRSPAHRRRRPQPDHDGGLRDRDGRRGARAASTRARASPPRTSPLVSSRGGRRQLISRVSCSRRWPSASSGRRAAYHSAVELGPCPEKVRPRPAALRDGSISRSSAPCPRAGRSRSPSRCGRRPTARALRGEPSSPSRVVRDTGRSAAPATTSTCSARCCARASSCSSTCAARATRARSTARACSAASVSDTRGVAECAAILGRDYGSYRTSAAADDIDDVRRALGIESISLYGDSYGTFLAQSYAFRHGRRLEALVLDSAYPVRGEDPLYPSLWRTGIRALTIACDRASRCHGDAGARLERMVALLRETPRGVGPLLDAIAYSGYEPPTRYFLQIDDGDQRVPRRRPPALPSPDRSRARAATAAIATTRAATSWRSAATTIRCCGTSAAARRRGACSWVRP